MKLNIYIFTIYIHIYKRPLYKWVCFKNNELKRFTEDSWLIPAPNKI